MILLYIFLAMLSALSLAVAVAVVYKEGEKELIYKYGQEEKR